MFTPQLPSLRVQFIAMLGMILTTYLVMVSYPHIQQYSPCTTIGVASYPDGRHCWIVTPQRKEACEAPCAPNFFKECKPVMSGFKKICYNGTSLTIVEDIDYIMEFVLVVGIVFGYLILSAAMLRSHWFRPPYSAHPHTV